jgi:cell division control protein 45
MVYLSPPHLANAGRPSYAEAYAKILADFRSSPLTSASSVLILVAPDADAVCAARMLSDLFNQDDVIHRIKPVSGFDELERIRDDLTNYMEVVQVQLYLHVLADRSYVAPHPHSS